MQRCTPTQLASRSCVMSEVPGIPIEGEEAESGSQQGLHEVDGEEVGLLHVRLQREL